MGKDKGNVGYFWRHVFVTRKSGPKRSFSLNPDTYGQLENKGEDGGYFYAWDFVRQQISGVEAGRGDRSSLEVRLYGEPAAAERQA